MNRSLDWKPKKHSQRVAAWIYTVINPIVEGLQRELELLDSGNLSWRFYSQRCEFIRPLSEYVDGNQEPNYTDFLAENTKYRQRFQSHDGTLTAVNNSASALFGALISNPQFVAIVESSSVAYEQARQGDPLAPDLSNMQGDNVKYAAEYLINNYRALPSHYSMAKFWSIASDAMHSFRASSGLFGQVQENARILKHESEELVPDLESLRRDFSRRFDLPAAPIPDYLQRH
jgi:hypothetical protein